MIRDYKREDLDQLKEIMKEGYLIDDKSIENYFENDYSKTFVYDDGAIKGVVMASMKDKEKKECFVLVYTKPSERRRGIGRDLYSRIHEYLHEIKPNMVYLKFRADGDNPTKFFADLGFKKWFGIHDMHYRGDLQPEPDLTISPYQEEFFLQYAKGIDDCFYEMRKENDIKPYYCSPPTDENRQNVLEEKDNIFLALDGDKLIASAIVKKDGYLDDIFVIPEYQGKGYGRKITEFAINKALSYNPQVISLGVVEWNTKAANLYEALGFERIQTTHYYRQFWGK